MVLLGGTEVVLSRVGPGAFFALFGTIALGMSLFYRVEIAPLAAATGKGKISVTGTAGSEEVRWTTTRKGCGEPAWA